MSKLSDIRKQIAALEAQATQITKEEMDAAIAKVKSLMSKFGLTLEHLGQSLTGKAALKKSKSAAKKVPSPAKFADPKSGKTWSGFGRAPGWIANVKTRDAFLVNKSAAPATEKVRVAASKGKLATKKASTEKSVIKAATPAKKRVKAVAKKASAPLKKTTAAAKKAVSKKVAPAKKAASKRVAARRVSKTTAPGPAPAPVAAAE